MPCMLEFNVTEDFNYCWLASIFIANKRSMLNTPLRDLALKQLGGELPFLASLL